MYGYERIYYTRIYEYIVFERKKYVKNYHIFLTIVRRSIKKPLISFEYYFFFCLFVFTERILSTSYLWWALDRTDKTRIISPQGINYFSAVNKKKKHKKTLIANHRSAGTTRVVVRHVDLGFFFFNYCCLNTTFFLPDSLISQTFVAPMIAELWFQRSFWPGFFFLRIQQMEYKWVFQFFVPRPKARFVELFFNFP